MSQNKKPTLSRDPHHVSHALTELVAVRGLARVRGDWQLSELWRQLAGDRFAVGTRVLGMRRGVLEIGVSNASMLSELVGFHSDELLEQLRETHPELNVRGLRFRRAA